MKNLLKFVCLTFIAFVGIFLCACGEVIVTPSISLESSDIELIIGNDNTQTKELEILLENYANGDARLNFSTDSAGLITYISEYISAGRTKLTVTGVQPGTATISIRSLQGGATNTIKVKIIQPIQDFSLKNEYLGKLYAIVGDSLNLNLNYFYNFTPSNTTEKDLNFTIKTQDSNCTITGDGILNVDEDCNLDKIAIVATSIHDENISIEFEIKILKSINAILEYNYVGVTPVEVENNDNNYLKIYTSDPDKNLAIAILTVDAGTQNEKLYIDKIFNATNPNFLVSQTNYEFINGQHIYTYSIQSNTNDAGKIDSIIFNISYESYTIGENDYIVSTNKLNISSYNSPTAIKVNDQIGTANIEIFENSSPGANGKSLEFTVLPGFLEVDSDKVRIWAEDIENCPISLYKLNATKTAYICVYGYNSSGDFICTNTNFTTGNIPYLEINSGAKLYAFINSKYDSMDNRTTSLYSQSSIYYDQILDEEEKALTQINFVINPNAQNIYLADLIDGEIEKNDETIINVVYGETITQYIAVDPSSFIIGTASRVSLVNNNLATLGNLTTIITDENYVYASFTIQSLRLGSTILTITLSDGTTKNITLNIICPLQELNVDIEDLNDDLESDMIAFTSIIGTNVTVGEDNYSGLNKISIVNSGSTIQLLKTATPSNGQYYLQYSFFDYNSEGVTIENITITKEALDSIAWGQTSDILKVPSMNNFSIIEALNSKKEGNVLLKIDVYGMEINGEYSDAPVGSIYYLINFFIPVSGMTITNGTQTLYPYNAIGDLFVKDNGESKSFGTVTVSVNSNNGSVSPTYMNSLKVYVNGGFFPIEFTNDFCYLNENGDVTYSIENATLKVIKTLTGNVYTFNVQALKNVEQRYIFTFVVEEVNNRKFTGIARIFVEDVVEISDIELVNVNDEDGIYFSNPDNANEDMSLVIYTNLYSSDGREITNNRLTFETSWTTAYVNGVNILEEVNFNQILRNLISITSFGDNGNYILSVDKSFSGIGSIRIYPESNYFDGWNDENPSYEIPILIADGSTDSTAIRIGNETEFVNLLNYSDKYYILTNNLTIDCAGIIDFAGSLNGNDCTISVKGPIFENISSTGKVENLNILALPSSQIVCKYADFEIEINEFITLDIKTFGFLACLNEGTITDVNIEGNTNFTATAELINTDIFETSTTIDAMGLLVGANKGSILYDNEEYEINVYGTNNGLNGVGATYAGGITGFNVGIISGAHVAVTVTGTYVDNFAGNEGDDNTQIKELGTITDCTYGLYDIISFYADLNESSEKMISSLDNTKAILYYNEVFGTLLNEKEASDLKKENTFNFDSFLNINGIIAPEEGEDPELVSLNYSLFNITSSNKEIIDVVGNSLEIKGVGKVTLTITPKYSSADNQEKSITIYIIYPISNYEIYEGINTEASSNKIDNAEEIINVKKSNTHYFTTLLKSSVVLDYNLFNTTQNNLALSLDLKLDGELSEDFIISGITTNFEKEELDTDCYFGTGTISLKAKDTVSIGSYYTLMASLVFQNENQVLGNINSTDNLSDFTTISTMLKNVFSKNITINPIIGAEKIQGSLIGAKIDPSNVLSTNIVLNTDDPNDYLIIEIKDEDENIVWKATNHGDIFEVIGTQYESFSNNKILFNVLVYIQDDYRARISETKNYKVYVYSGSEESVYFVIDLIVEPQEIISVTYTHYNRDDNSTEDNFKVQSEPSSILAPGDNGLLAINLYPIYAAYKRIEIESELVNGYYILMEQMYEENNSYFSANGNGYSNSRNENKLTIYHSDAMINDNGMVYIRTKLLNSVSEGLYFPLTITIYMEAENGEEKIVKTEQIILVSQLIDGATITINDTDEAVVVRGHSCEIQITVPIYQDLANYGVSEKNISDDINDSIDIDFNKAEYEIINNRKVYTGVLNIGLNAELTGDGVFKIFTIVSRIINGRLESTYDTIEITVVDFLVEGIYLKGNDEDNNIFDTPLAIEKDLEFEFILSDKPDYYDTDQQVAVERIENSKKYFLKNMAYKYASGDYSYIINTTRAFVRDFNVPTEEEGGIAADYLTHVVASQSPNSIAYNLYYTNDMVRYVNTDGNEYVSIHYNNDGDTSDFASNLLKITGTKIGNIGLTIKIGYNLPGINEISYLIYNFVIQVQPYAEEDRPTPIYTEDEFIEYLSNENEENAEHNYILMENLTFIDYIPIESTYFSSLDGNNKIISIKSFGLVSNSNTLDIALFKEVTENVTLKNLTINFYELQDIVINEQQYNIINIAGLALYNSGVIYNCEIVAIDINNTGVHNADCGIKVYFDIDNKAKPKQDTTTVNIAGLVLTNDTNGCITNSRVGNIDGVSFKRITGNSSSANYETFDYHNLNIIGQGNITGFVMTNSGVISASFFSSGRIINYSVSGTEAITSGFVVTNHMGAVINGCYSNGIKLATDSEIYITGDGITAQGVASGFLYENEGNVSDCYSNIKLSGTSSGRIVSGFIYNNRNNGLIERCYSASTIVGDLTTQMPFTGNDAYGNSKQEVINGLVNCYYIVRVYSEESVMEEKYSTGATALPLSTLTNEKFYGFTFVSEEGLQDGSWYWNGTSAKLVEANHIAISTRYIISNYDVLLSSGQSTESINVFPYIKGYEYGSSNNPIIIRTADEFNRAFGQETSLVQGAYYAISQMYDKAKGVVFGSYRLVSHIDFDNLTNVENVKISSSIMNLTQKGENKGAFDGNGLTISNVEISLNSQKIVGLISKLTNSSVFKNVNITIIKITAGTGVYVGGAIGQVENSFVNNVKVIPVNTTMGDEKSQVAGYNIVGGVIGFAVGNSRLSNLSSSISVTSLCKTSDQIYSRYKQTLVDNSLLSYAGGIVGIIDIYDDLFSSGVYSSQFDVNKLKYYGKNVSVQGKFVGGVVGYVGVSTYFADALFEITGLYNETFNQKLISYGETIGGIIGVNYGKLYEIRIEHQFVTQQRIEKNIGIYYTTTAFRGISTLFNALDTDYNLKYIGGLVGEMRDGELTSSYSKIDVVNDKSEYAGGLIGYNEAETIFYELFAFGDVAASSIDGYSGGLIGYNNENIQLNLCVAMNFYNKLNKNLQVTETTPITNTGRYIPIRLGALIGENGQSSVTISTDVFATNIFTIGENEFYFSDIVSEFNFSDIDSEENVKVSQDLTISKKNLALFDKNVDIVTSNEMFINSGWDISVWTKENDRLFPYFNFGISNQILYIEKASDLANIFRFSNQSDTIIFGDDPNTRFNPYDYNPDDLGTFGEFDIEDLKGLEEVIGNNLIFDISKVDFSIEDTTYFSNFLGTMYGEDQDWNYVIKGMEKSLFEEIIGGTIQNISFIDSNLEDVPVLAETISYEATLIDLTFENINIKDLDSESGSYMLGIVAKQMKKISKLENITINDCTIDCSYINNEDIETNDIYLGGIAGIMDSQGISNYQGYYKNININNLTINYNSSTNLDETEGLVYAGLLFGEINYKAKYENCIIEGDNNSININVGPDTDNNTAIYAGGYVGSASSNLQILINSSENLLFVDNLYILIQNCEKLNAGLLFGEAQVASNGDGTSSTTNGDLNIEISGLITNKYKFNENVLTYREAPKSIVADVGGIVGNGSGSLCGVTVNGLFIDTADDYILIDLQTKCKDSIDNESIDFGSTEIVKVGGVIGNSTVSELYISSVNVYGDIIVSDEESGTQLLIVGGIVGYTGNGYEIYNSGYKNNDLTSDIVVEGLEDNTIVYAGGIIGYSYTVMGITFKIGNYEGETCSNGCMFEGNLNVSNINKLYAGGIIGATSDGIAGSVNKKIGIYDSLVSGNIEMSSNINLSSLIIGGIAGIVAADVENNYAWGNIKTNLEGVTIDNLYLGGIVGNLKGLGYQNALFYSNYSMTSIYNIYRGETTHNVKSLIGIRSYVNVGTGVNSNYYCHQISLCTDDIGNNLYYYTDKSSPSQSTILSKFESRELSGEVGSKLNPNEITEINGSTEFSAGQYYVISQDITSSVSADVVGHLVGDGYKITTSALVCSKPFNVISGAVSGLTTQCTYAFSLLNPVIGFASKNEGVIFAISSYVTYHAYTNSGFVVENTGLIADCGTVLLGSSAGSGFCALNSGVIQNCYSTGALTTGVNNQNGTYLRGVFAGSSGDGAGEYNSKGKIVNCYVALKSNLSSSAFYGASISNCYYDRNAAEKDLGNISGSIIRKNTADISTLSANSTSFISNLGSNWTQNYYQNFGYPTLSAGAYEDFGYLCENFYTGNSTTSNESDYIQIPNAGKLQQIKYNGDLGSKKALRANYKLINDINLNAAFAEPEEVYQWNPIGSSNTNYFSGKFDGQGNTISNLTITQSSVSDGYYGLFGYVKGVSSTNKSEIKDINFTGTNINISRNGSVYSGAVVGRIENYALVSGCENSGSISAESTGSLTYVGSIIGKSSNSEISECENTGDLTADGSFDNYIGGIVGSAINSEISNCTNQGNITGNITENSYNSVGGIVGYLYNSGVSSCKNSWNITGNSKVGGIVGICTSSTTTNLTNNENEGKITGNSYLGGIIGKANSYVYISGGLSSGDIDCIPLRNYDAWANQSLKSWDVDEQWPRASKGTGWPIGSSNDGWELFHMLGANATFQDFEPEENGVVDTYPTYSPSFTINILQNRYLGLASGSGGHVSEGNYTSSTILFNITFYSMDVKKTAGLVADDDDIKINIWKYNINNNTNSTILNQKQGQSNYTFISGTDLYNSIKNNRTQLYLYNGNEMFPDTNPGTLEYPQYRSLEFLEGEDGSIWQIINQIIIKKAYGGYLYFTKLY